MPTPTKVWPEFFEGIEEILYQGKKLEIEFIKTKGLKKIRIEEDVKLPTHRLKIQSHPEIHSKTKIQKALLSYFKIKLEELLRPMLQYHLPKVARPPETIRIRPFKSQWGSCHPNGTLKLNFNLLFTPPETLEYVLVHELAHLKHMNHSKAFWEHVSEMLPDFKSRAKLLKAYSAVLYWQKVPKI